MPRLPPPPDLIWSAEGAPEARAFGDVYFSKAGGLDETEAVFLAGCGLPEAWAGRARFSVCELGFGTGLNALALWRAWRRARPPGAVLHMASIEAFPLAREEAARALAAFPEVADLAARLLAAWPVRAYAPQRLWFPDDGFALTVHVGEAEAMLRGLRGAFDAWFLDGFAPARNPSMWDDALMARVAALSAPGARLATYSVAGGVRRALEAAGFAVEKKPGFGRKRERLEAVLGPPASAPAARRFPSTSSGKPVRRALPELVEGKVQPAGAGAGGPSFPLYPYAAAHPKRVAILGAGIAGAAAAHALARRGVETIVLDASAALGAGASGNPAGLIMPRLDRGVGPLRELFLAGFLEAAATYQALGPEVFAACGVEEMAERDKRAALADLLADPPLPEDWYAPSGAGALHKRAGVVRPQAAIKAFLRDASLMLEAPVAALERAGAGWRLLAPDGKARLAADAVIIACGPALTRLDATRFLPLSLTRGQIEWGPLAGAPPVHARARGEYFAPFKNETSQNAIVFGATFDRVESDAAPLTNRAARTANLAALARLDPDLRARIDEARLASRAGMRAALPDFAPVAGLLPDAEAWKARFASISKGAKPDLSSPAPALDGLYVLGGLGARGLTMAPLLGERIAAELFGEPQVLSGPALDAAHPARFLHRRLKRSN